MAGINELVQRYIHRPQTMDQELLHLIAKCYVKLGAWCDAKNRNLIADDRRQTEVFKYYDRATKYDKNWYKVSVILQCSKCILQSKCNLTM